jgi:hypothetical protein
MSISCPVPLWVNFNEEYFEVEWVAIDLLVRWWCNLANWQIDKKKRD